MSAIPPDGSPLRPGEISPDDVRAVRDALDGLAALATGLAERAEHSQTEPAAIDALGDLARMGRDRLRRALDEAEMRA